MSYTNGLDDPSAHFQTATYAGNGSTQSITNDGNSDLQPDWVWTKSRSDSSFHLVTDSTRGTSKRIYSNSESAEESHSNMVTAFNSDGFSIGSHSAINTNNYNYVGWQWKANGGTTASNTVGDIDSVVQANTDAGFAIVTYTGNGSANQTIGHGLGAVPKMVLFKNRSSGQYWYVYHVATGNDTMTYLNLSNAAQSLSSQFSTPTTTTFNVSNENSTFSGYNTSGNTYVAYVFADVQGYSKFGKYVGNGNVNGPFVYLGFQPAWLLLKRSDSATGGNWHIIDNKRSASGGANVNIYSITANTADAESTGEAESTYGVDFLSNGFKIRASHSTRNTSGGTYIYMAFAESPFVTSTGIMGTAR